MKILLVTILAATALGALISLPFVYNSGYKAGLESAQADPANPSSKQEDNSKPNTIAANQPGEPYSSPSATPANPASPVSPLYQALDSQIQNVTADLPIAQAMDIWAKIEALPNGPEKREREIEFLKAFGKAHGQEAFIAFLDDSNPNSLRNIGPIAAGWAQHSPKDAWAALLAASNNGAIRGIDLRSTILEIANTDLVGALQMVNDLQGSRRNSEFRALLRNQSDPAAFETIFATTLQIEDSAQRSRSIQALFDAWSDVDFDTSLVAIEAIPDADTARSSMHGILNSWAQRDGAAAYAYALENQADPNVQGSLLSVARNWLRSSSAFEADEVFEAINTMPNRDQALQNLSRELVAVNPEATMQMIESIEDDRLRNRTFQRSVSSWGRNDIDAAEFYVANVEDEASRANMLSSLSISRLQQGGGLESYADAISQIEESRNRQRVLISLRRGIDNLGARATTEQQRAVDTIFNEFSADLENVTFMPDGRVRIRRNTRTPEG